MIRRVLVDMFQLDGHEVTVAADGDAGLRHLRASQNNGRGFDLVVTDFGMPQMDGQQFAFAVRRIAPELPIILLTGWGKIMKEDADELGLAVDHVISKPPRVKELRRVVAEIFGPVRARAQEPTAAAD